MMIIVVERGLKNLKNELEIEGFKVVYTDEIKHGVNVYISGRVKSMDDTCFESIEIRHRNSNSDLYGTITTISSVGKSIAQIKNEIRTNNNKGSF